MVLVMYFIFSAILFIALRTFDKSAVAAGVVPFLTALLMGLEGSTLRRWTFARNGWQDLGIVVADKRDAAERRFFEAWTTSGRGGAHESTAPGVTASPVTMTYRMPSGQAKPEVVGLFPDPGGNR
jgi:hypothetical protein